jgi:hypothetical protein
VGPGDCYEHFIDEMKSGKYYLVKDVDPLLDERDKQAKHIRELDEEIEALRKLIRKVSKHWFAHNDIDMDSVVTSIDLYLARIDELAGDKEE